MLFLSLFGLASAADPCVTNPNACSQIAVGSQAELAEQISRARMEVKAQGRQISVLQVEVSYLTCEQRIDTLKDGRDPWLLFGEKAEAQRLAEIKSCKSEFKIDIEPAYKTWVARNGAPAPTTSSASSTTPAPAATTVPPIANAPAVSSAPQASVPETVTASWWANGDKGFRVSAGLGAAGMRIDGHANKDNPRFTSYMGSVTAEAKYGFGIAGIGVRGGYFPEILNNGYAVAGHLVGSFYVDEARTFFHLDPLVGYSVQTMGETYNEDRIELGLSAAGRFARNWEIVGTGVYGIDPDTAHTPDNAWRLGIEFRGTVAFGDR